MSKSHFYETYFMDWLNKQKLALVNRDVTALDWENLAEELDIMMNFTFYSQNYHALPFVRLPTQNRELIYKQN